MEKKITNLEATIANLSGDSAMQREGIPKGTPGAPNMPSASGNGTAGLRVASSHHRPVVLPANYRDVVMDMNSGLGAMPGFFLADTPPDAQDPYEDLVSRKIISLDKAQVYFDRYMNRLDHFPYRILGGYDDLSLDSIRRASPLLTSAVCTVGALHSASDDYDECYREFYALSAKRSFSKPNEIEDVQALCIGAFWLSDLSWALSGAAVRIAAELQLHKSIFKAIQGDRRHYLRTRLWFLVYACDHHFSIVYGRPPMTRECEAVRNVRRFLDSVHATEDDSRLASQVLRWSMCSNILDTFGVDVDRPLSDTEIPLIQKFGAALDTLRAEWAERFRPSSHVGNYPKKGVALQYHFAKLYLYSHAFRGAGPSQAKSRSPEATMELEEATNSAFLAALSILRTVVLDPEIQSHLDGLPIYFHTMVASAAVFLLKATTRHSGLVQFDSREVRRLVHDLVETLTGVTSTMHQRHLLVGITKGLRVLLQQCNHDIENSPLVATGEAPEGLGAETFLEGNVGPSWDSSILGEYDFFLYQDLNQATNDS